MESHNICTARGFTLIEMLTVLGLLACALALPLSIDLNQYRTDALQAQRTTVVSILQEARMEALNSVDHAPHGVVIFPTEHPDSYVLFEGETYGPDKEENIYPGTYTITLDPGSLREVVFEPGTGLVPANGEIVLVDPVRAIQTTISINSEGRID